MPYEQVLQKKKEVYILYICVYTVYIYFYLYEISPPTVWIALVEHFAVWQGMHGFISSSEIFPSKFCNKTKMQKLKDDVG